MIRRFLYEIKKNIVRFPIRFYNSLQLMKLPSGSYLFVNMSVKWKGLSLIKYNFGDDLNVYLLEELTNKKILKYDEFLHIKNRNVLCIGSVIEYLCDNSSIIWGSGALYGNSKMKVRPKSALALRGPLTRDYLEANKIQCPDIYGDPALLLPTVYFPMISKRYLIGFVPHYKDLNSVVIQRFVANNKDVTIINLHEYSSWKDTINEFLSCNIIISSSLHGLIISDAYGIPNVRVVFSDLIAGGNFKYNDYFASVGRQIQEPINCKNEIKLDEIQKQLENYSKINFDSRKLLDVFPFPLADKFLNPERTH